MLFGDSPVPYIGVHIATEAVSPAVADGGFCRIKKARFLIGKRAFLCVRIVYRIAYL